MKKKLGFTLLCVALAVAGVRADTTLVFNEIMYHPSTNEPGLEWVELHNQLAVDLDISDWRISGDINFKFPAGTRAPGRGFIVVAANPAALMAATGLTNVFGPVTNRLANNGGTIEIRNNSDRLLDRVDFGVDGEWPVTPDGSGVSLAKRDRDFGSAKASSWTQSAQIGGTPGADNFPLTSSVRLIAINDAWRYEASGTDLGTAWRNPTFNESAWASRIGFTNRAITTLFNTGVGDDRVVIAPGGTDPHYILTAGAQGTVGANVIAILNHPNWLANDAVSSFIGVVTPGATTINGGGYNFQTTFSLDGFIPGTAQVNLNVAVDNLLTNVFINGLPTGLNTAGFALLNPPLTVTSGFVPGANALEFRTVNEGAGPGGFRATLNGSALAARTDLAAGNSTYYFRKSFNFGADPKYSALMINPVVADGAVFYLNGVEVYRQNMPAGSAAYSTAAATNVASPDLSGPITISVSNLVQGANVLAVEVHQAAGGADGPVFGTELAYAASAEPPLALAFNEISAATNASFWLELVNYGTNAIPLGGYVITRDIQGTNVTANYVIPSGTTISAGGFLVLSNSTLGFAPLSGDKLFLFAPNKANVVAGVIARNGPRARFPGGTGDWLIPNVPTPGAANSFAFRNEIVINEIMYHHKALPPVSANIPPKDNPEAWIELYNRSSNTVDLTGWELGGGISYRFAAGKTIPAGGYLIVADDAADLRAKYSSLDTVGNLGGRLSHSDDHIVLRDPLGNPADEVHYYTGGRWPEYPDGGGSSLELRDPTADNSKAEAWASSDETSKSSWQNYTYRMVANIPAGSGQPPTTQWQDFILGLQAGGECFIDDLNVVELPTSAPAQVIANGDFENGLTGWRVLGTHGRSRVETDPANPGNHVLHLIATGAQEHMHNHIETTLTGGRQIVSGREYEISFRARWLGGNHLLNTRLYFNRSGRTTALSYPQSNGTPGARNSSYVANAGPTFSDFGHQPIVPAANEPVTVSAIAQDPQGVTSARVFWSVNSGAWSNAAMTAGSSGRYTGTIPGQSAGAVVQFYVQATDSLGATATFPARGTNSGALYKVDDGQAILSLAHNVRVILTPANIDLLHGTAQGSNQTNVMSNDLHPCTVIYDERRAYYDCGVHLRGSQRGRYSDIRTGFHLDFQPDDLFRGVHPVMSVDRSGQGDSAVNRQEEVVIRHILNRAGGIPGAYTEIARLLAPRAAHTGPVQFFPRQEDVVAETAFENGGDGTFYEMELIYYPTTANAAGYKNPQPDAVIGTDVTDLGDDKELYRYNFIIKNHRDADDYSRFIALGKAWALPAGSAALDAATRQLMDVDEWMRGYALVSLCAVGDMYGFGNNHNFLIYNRPSDGKFIYFPTDMDFAFSRGATAALVGDQNLAKVVNLPGNLRRLYAHMLDMIGTCFNTNYMASWMAHYASFAPGQNYSGLGTASPGNSLGIMAARVPFVQSTISGAGGNTPFNVAVTNLSTGNNLVAITGTAPVQVKTIEINGKEYPITWTSISAWRISVPVSEATTALNVLGRDYSGTVISNTARAITVAYTNALPPDPRGVIVFNEIMFNPLKPDAAYIELFNTSSNFTYDLSGWEINGLGFTFPNGSIITNRQYLVIAANAASYIAAYGTGAGTPIAEFSGNLQNDGETLTLIKPGATTNDVAVVVDKIRYESTAPWPTVANGTGSSIQLIDAAQDNSRPLNWYSFHVPSISYPAVTNVGWVFRSISASGGASATRLALYIDAPGDVYVDDISVVEGTNAAVGINLVRNGDFESPLLEDPPLTNSWLVPTNYTNTAISSQLIHSGNGSLHLTGAVAGAQLSRIMLQNLSPAPTSASPYTLSFWFFATNTASNVVCRVLNTSMNMTASVRPTIDPASNTVAVVALSPGAANQQTATLAPVPPLWINELQADNVSGIQDNNGQRDPWIELYNSGTSAVSLDGLFLSPNYTNLTNWAFPAGRTLGAGQFMVIFCDAQPAQTTPAQLHTSFRLTSGAGSVAISRLENGVARVLDYVNYSGVRSNNSYGSIPDGQQFERREFAFPTPGGTNDGRSAPLRVFINEWMAGNTNGITDPADGANDDWFELYNPGDTAVDLTGYFLTDNLADKFQYEIGTNGTHTIPARGYLLVWADSETGQNSSGGVARPDLHVNFRLAQTGEAIALFAADGTQIDAITFTNQTDDVSQGRFTDGSTNIVLMPNSATPRSANRLDGAVPQVQFSAPALNGNNFVLTWSTTAGKTYRVEYKNDLGAAIWLPLGSNIVATGNVLSMTDSITNSPQRFFRIQVLP